MPPQKEEEIGLSREELMPKPESSKQRIISGKLENLKKTGSVLKQRSTRNQYITVQDALANVTAASGKKFQLDDLNVLSFLVSSWMGRFNILNSHL